MKRRWLLGGLRSGALEEGRERSTRGPPAKGEGRAGNGTFRRSKGRNLDEIGELACPAASRRSTTGLMVRDYCAVEVEEAEDYLSIYC